MGKRKSYQPYELHGYRLNWYRGGFAVAWNEGDKRRRYELGTKDEEDGRAALVAFVRKRQLLQVGTPETMAQFFDLYVNDREIEGKRIEKMKWVWKALKPNFAKLQPALIDKKICRDYADARRAIGRKEHTIHGELKLLRTVINWAAKSGLLVNPPYIWMPPRPEPSDRYLTREEFKALLDAAHMPHIRLFLILAISTAGRKQAILDLTWDRIDFERGRINLVDPDKPKTNKGRAIVPINDSARAALLEAQPGAVTNHVIEWAGGGIKDIKRGFAKAVEKSGLHNVTPHVLRHTAAVWMAEAKVPMSEISQYLGHSSTAVTERVYARYSSDYLKGAADVLNIPLLRSASG